MSAGAIDSEPIVVAEGLAKSWGDRLVFRDATFAIGAGVTGLLGPNGAGKTTLFGMLLGLHPASGGALRVLGLDPRTAGPMVRQRLGYSPEHEALPSDMGAYDFVRHVAELHGLPRRAAAGRASDALYEVGLGEERARPCGTMSTGQKQRVKLAQAIVHDPSLVLLDEPTNGLDPVQRDEMLALIRRCGHELGLSVVVSSHLLDEIERTCDRVVIVADERIAGGGTIAEATGSQQSGTAPLRIELDCSGDYATAFADALRSVGYDVRQDALHLPVVEIPAADLAATRAVRDLLAAWGLGVRSMRRRTRSLEDVFLDATDHTRAPEEPSGSDESDQAPSTGVAR